MEKVSPDKKNEKVRKFKKEILSYYKKNKREFPWRNNFDPYGIVVSEIMLQQTQALRVVPKFLSFMKRFPDFETLAKAPTSDVLHEWQGLGYNRRAIGLKKIAEKVVGEFSGEMPRDYEQLVELPSIGKATANSIATFAWNVPRPFIETNIRRVFIYFFFPKRDRVDDSELFPLIEKTTPKNNSRDWYYALMDYGAMLKEKVPNPNRKSAHYRVQSKFEGSNRQVRGKILRYLLAKQPRTVRVMRKDLAEDTMRIDSNIAALAAEGFIIKKGERIYLAK